jgi:hypothetical protein
MPSSIADPPSDDGLTGIRSCADLGALFAGKAPEEWRAAYASAYDWGPDVGREAVEE